MVGESVRPAKTEDNVGESVGPTEEGVIAGESIGPARRENETENDPE